MSMTKGIRREGCKNAFSRCLVGLALAAVAVDSAAAGRAALVPDIDDRGLAARATVMRPAARQDTSLSFILHQGGRHRAGPACRSD